MMYAPIGTVMAQYNTAQSRIRNAINSKMQSPMQNVT